MATIVNDRDVLLQAASPRTLTLTLTGLTVQDAVDALAAISAISSDSILSAGEKPGVVLSYNTILADQAALDTQATSFGITTEKTAYDTAITALTTYLTGLSPAYNSYTTDTTIVSATFNTKFSDVYSAKQALLNKIAALAAGGTLTNSGAINTVMLGTNAATEIYNAADTGSYVTGSSGLAPVSFSTTVVSNIIVTVSCDTSATNSSGSTKNMYGIVRPDLGYNNGVTFVNPGSPPQATIRQPILNGDTYSSRQTLTYTYTAIPAGQTVNCSCYTSDHLSATQALTYSNINVKVEVIKR